MSVTHARGMSAARVMSNRKKRFETTGVTKTAGARSPAERLEPGRAPSRPRGLQAREPSRFLKGTVRFVSALFTLSLVTMVVFGGAGFVLYNQFQAPGPLEAPRTITIPKGESRIAIADRLEREGIISNHWTFVGGHLMRTLFGSKKAQDLKAGEYEIKEHASMQQVMETLAEGKSILYKVTIPEGLTSQQIVERLKAEPSLSGDVATVPAEGTLLPDTYSFSKGALRQDIVDQMQAAMTKAVAALWDKRVAELPLKSPEEAVTFASIVEKETGKSDERDRVAAVFYNRLRKGMRLQSDPTIIYGIAGGAGALGRSITKTDIEAKTPYNTYQINGLPPGPIANPGKASLEAALNPAKTNDLYFVADGTGGHAFTDNLKDHNAAVQKWREAEKQAKAASDSKDLQIDPGALPIPQNEPQSDAKSDAKPDGKPDAAPSGEKAKQAKNKTDPAKPGPTTLLNASPSGKTSPANAASIPLPERKPKAP